MNVANDRHRDPARACETEEERKRGREEGRAGPGISLVREGVTRMDVLASKFEEIAAFVRWNVARVVYARELVEQVATVVMDAIVGAAINRSDFDRVTSRWVQTTARRVSFARRRSSRRLVCMNFDPPAPTSSSTPVRTDPVLCAAVDFALSRLGRKSRVAMMTLRSTANIELAMAASGMTESNVFRARRRLSELAREFLSGVTGPEHLFPSVNHDS